MLQLTLRALLLQVCVSCFGPDESTRVASIIELAASLDTIVVEDTLHLRATARDKGGAPITGRPVVWTSSNPLVVSVDSDGVVRAIARGTATVRASMDNAISGRNISVRDPFLSIQIRRRFPSAFADDTTLLRVSATDSSGSSMTRPFASWSSSNSTVATISRDGIVSTHVVGVTMLRARIGHSLDSTELVVLSKRTGPNRELAFMTANTSSPSSDEVWGAAANGASLRRLSLAGRTVASFRWNRTGSLLAVSYYSRPQLGESPLFELVDIDQGARTTLSESVELPDVSPDGRTIAFTDGIRGEVATMAVDGSQRRFFNPLIGTELAPRWSPDGRQIAFLFNPGPGDFQIWVMDADGEYPKRISAGTFARNPEWSPDGKHLSYDDASRVWISNVETLETRSLTPLGVVGFATWSADATRLLYGDGNFGLALRTASGALITELSTLGLFHYVGSLSPDGSKVALVRVEPGSGSFVWVTDLMGTGATAVSDVNSWFPAWRP